MFKMYLKTLYQDTVS